MQKQKQKVVLRQHTGTIFWIAAVLLCLSHLFENPVYRFADEALWRIRFILLRQIRPGRTLPQVLLIEEEGDLDPMRLARAIPRLDAAGVKTIGIDMPLPANGLPPETLRALEAAIRTSQRVILSSQAQESAVLGHLVEPSPELKKAAVDTGFAVIGRNSRGEASRISLAGLTRDASVVGWPLTLLYHQLSVPGFARFIKDGVITLKVPGAEEPRKIPLDSTGSTRIHYRFARLLRSRTLGELEAGAIPREELEDKLVLLPCRSLDGTARVETPTGHSMTRTRALGCAVATLVTGDVIRPASRLLEVGLILLFALPLVLLGWRKEPLWVLAGAILTCLAWWVASLVLLATIQLVLPIARPLALLVLLTVCGLLRHQFRTLVGVVRSDAVKLNDAQAALNLGIKMMQAGKIDDSIKYFQKVAGTEGDMSSKGNFMLALVLLKKGDTTSVTNLVKSIDMEALDEQEAYQLAEELETHGQLDTAHTVFSKIMKTNISYRDVKDRLRNIQDRLAGVTEEDIALMVVHKVLHKRFQEPTLLGRGGMGFVYKAADAEAGGREVAIKVLSPFYANHEDIYRRFIREARGIASFDCPRIIQVFDVFQENLPYYSMEFLTSRSLKEILREGKLPLAEIVKISLHACEGLAYAHERGITHRDVKPDNIMLDASGDAKVIDFGIAHFEDQTSMTQTGHAIGTPLYMSPEQVKGLDIDHRSDIYSYGVVLYEMLAGRPPFMAMAEHLTTRPPPFPPELEIPELLQKVVFQALAKRQEERFQSMEEFMQALQMVEMS